MRARIIIKELIDSNQYLSIDYFMDKLSLSKRTIQNEFSYINKISKANGFEIIKKRGKGYLIEVKNEEKLNKFLSNNRNFNNKLNLSNLLAYLITKQSYITINELSNYFGMSSTSIRKCIDDLEEYLKKYDINLDRKAHYGIKIKEDIYSRRFLILKLFIENNQIILKEIKSIDNYGLKKVDEIFISYLKKENYDINDLEFNKIVSFIKIIIYINKKEEEIIEECDIEFINNIQQYYNVGINKEQINEINFAIEKLVKKEKKLISIEGLKKDINLFLKKIDIEYSTKFYEDEEFKQLLINHIYLLIERLKSKVSYTNGIIEEILIRYPIIFNIALKFSNMIETEYNVDITEDEVGFIAMHFCVHMEKEEYKSYMNINRIAIVCSSGGGSSYLLKMKIKSLFKNSIIETFSFYDINSIEKFEPDIILSIKKLDLKINVPIIIIKEILDDNDIINIKKLLLFDSVEKQVSINETKKVFIKKIMKKRFFKVENYEKDYIKIISEMADEIENCGIGGKGYKKSVLERESYVSTVYTNGVAIPHPMEILGIEDLVSVRIVKSDMKSNCGENVNIIFMVSLQKKNYELHKEITSSIYNIMQDSEVVNKISKIENYEEFIALIEPFI